jgi:hypothetical protein
MRSNSVRTKKGLITELTAENARAPRDLVSVPLSEIVYNAMEDHIVPAGKGKGSNIRFFATWRLSGRAIRVS